MERWVCEECFAVFKSFEEYAEHGWVHCRCRLNRKHTFEKVRDNLYMCKNCGAKMYIKLYKE